MTNNVQESHSKGLTPIERAFVQLVADRLDKRSIGDKGVAAGWTDPTYGWRKYKQPHIAAAIDEEVEADCRAIRRRRREVLDELAERSVLGVEINDRDGNLIDVSFSDANKAAELFLLATGDITRGTRVVTNVSQNQVNNNEQFDDAIERVESERRIRYTTSDS